MIKKFLLKITFSTMLIFALILPVSIAHEIGELEGLNLSYRWYNISDVGDPWNSNRKAILLDVNGDYLTGNFETAYSSMKTNWNFTNTAKRQIRVYQTPFTSSKVDFAKRATWPSEWGANLAAVTELFNQNGVSHLSGNFNNGTVHYANVWINPNISVTTSLAKIILGHELGHVLGLGHPPSNTTSIMTNGQTSWETPQKHDKDDIDDFYP